MLFLGCAAGGLGVGLGLSAADRPNILWITSEDNGPQLGCYGDSYATTPNLDRLAAKGLLYRHVWSGAPVCAPARTAIITGMYPTSLGAEHMRSLVRLPPGVKLFPQLLREAGYYCSNNSKEDYNVEPPGQVWDESSARAHWRKRRPGQPFFAVFNHTQSHESQVRKRPHTWIHDPAKVRVPAYHPDTPEVRQDWAQYYDTLTEIDAAAGENLRELADAGLTEETIVFYFGDNGIGLPRCKRTACHSGLSVPLIVHVPPKFRHLAPADYTPGGSSARPVNFVDLAPTVLSLAGLRPPSPMQGRAFMGPLAGPAPGLLHGFRGRMDERPDLVRAVSDGRYVYLRNYLPLRIPGQHVAYMFETPTTRVWRQLFEQGKLPPSQQAFWLPKPAEELYDLENDPDEINNLAASAAHQPVLQRMRQAQREQLRRVRDLGLLPEAEVQRRAGADAPYTMGHDNRRYPLEAVLAAAELASSEETPALPQLRTGLRHPDSAVRYWAIMGLLIRGPGAVNELRSELLGARRDESPSVRIAAAEALGRFGTSDDLEPALAELLEFAHPGRHPVQEVIAALNAIDQLDAKAARYAEPIRSLPRAADFKPGRAGETADRLVPQILAELGR